MALQAQPFGLRSSIPTLRPRTGLSDRSAFHSGLFSPPVQLLTPTRQHQTPAKSRTTLKVTARVTAKQSYICRDCGYIYSDKTPFDKLPDKYFCPVCGAPKRRFRPYEPKVTKNANEKDVRKARKEQLKKDEAIGNALPIAIVIGAAALAGLYFYLNSTF